MTTTATPGNPGGWRQVAFRVAHKQPVILAVALVVFTLDATILPLPITVWCVALTAVMLTFFADSVHGQGLCLYCASAIPLDGPTRAAKHSDWLKLHHILTNPRSFWPVLVVCTIAMVVLPAGVALIPMYGLFIVQAVTSQRHRVLAPWCPQCHWGGGGGGESATEPVPPPVPSRHPSPH